MIGSRWKHVVLHYNGTSKDKQCRKRNGGFHSQAFYIFAASLIIHIVRNINAIEINSNPDRTILWYYYLLHIFHWHPICFFDCRIPAPVAIPCACPETWIRPRVTRSRPRRPWWGTSTSAESLPARPARKVKTVSYAYILCWFKMWRYIIVWLECRQYDLWNVLAILVMFEYIDRKKRHRILSVYVDSECKKNWTLSELHCEKS